MRIPKYESRFKAGELLAEFVERENKYLNKSLMEDKNQFFCFAILNGCMSVTEGFCSKYNLNYDLLIVRKIYSTFL